MTIRLSERIASIPWLPANEKSSSDFSDIFGSFHL